MPFQVRILGFLYKNSKKQYHVAYFQNFWRFYMEGAIQNDYQNVLK